MTTELLTKILDGGVRNVNFFEGRLLTAKDLRDQQEADQRRHWQLGRAIGAGVVEGFEVEVENDGKDGSVPVVKVKKGLAVNAAGEVLELTREYVQVKLSRTLETPEPEGDLFFTCANPPETKQIPNGAGIYILTVSPTKGYQDYAPMTGLDDNGKAGSCGRRYKVDGLTFRLIGLDPLNLSERSISESTRKILQDDLLSSGNPAKVGETARLSKLRNIIAHLCFGTERLAQFPVDPFSRSNGTSDYSAYGALDELHEIDGGLTECDVPLALFYWTLGGIAFYDLWSVRRKPLPSHLSRAWPLPFSRRSMTESEASFLQFQDQIDLLMNGSVPQASLASAEAENYFHILPAAGIIPVTISSLREYYSQKAGKAPDDLTGQDKGFNYSLFFRNMTVRDPVFIEGARAAHVICTALKYPAPATNSKEMLWLYLVRQNVESIRKDRQKQPRAYLVFTNGHMPFYGEARYDLARWDYSNFVNCFRNL